MRLNNSLCIAAAAALALFAATVSAQTSGSSTVNAICSTDQAWCELAAQEFSKATGIKVLQTRKATGEALAQLRAEANNPKTDGRRPGRTTSSSGGPAPQWTAKPAEFPEQTPAVPWDTPGEFRWNCGSPGPLRRAEPSWSSKTASKE